MEPDQIAAHMTPIARVALLRVHANPGTWRALPPAVRRSLRNEHLVHQNRDCEWVLTDTGHQVRKYLTKNTSKPVTYGPTFKKENQND